LAASDRPTSSGSYPQRQTLSLDGSWEFIRDPDRRFTVGGLTGGEPIIVPGPWEAQVAEPYGIVHGWYRRRFEIPDHWRHGTLLVRFGAVMARATVWLDGRLAGDHDDGYLPFDVEGGASRPGAICDLVVEVENPVNVLREYPGFGREALLATTDRLDGRSFEGMPHGKQTWYTSTSGLLGSVVVELAPDPRFASLVVLPDLEEGRALVRWRLGGMYRGEPATVHLTVTSPTGEIVAEDSADARASSATFVIPNPEPWDLWQPALYRLHARVQRQIPGNVDGGDDQEDEAVVRFGMRSIAVQDGAIHLNGRQIYFRGVLDQDFWPVGLSNPPSRAALEAQVGLIRGMGLNLVRCHIKIPDPAYLDVADEAGLLVWCELPSWVRFDLATGRTVRRMMEAMVETMGNHPSIVAWTVINEDWGTDLRHEARDRLWLRSTVDWLKAIDPSRLVVDNSACETPHGPNFHLRTDLADFHAYRSMPDGLPRWRSLIAEFARRPDWLWSSHGDAHRTGEEALVLSEFGGWGLPRPSAVLTADGREPWWWTTGQAIHRPAGLDLRFRRQGLDRIWPDLDALADATQWRQFEAFAAQVRELRRHPSIKGYVVTELADAFWEANGLLDAGRGRKVYHDRLAELNAPAVLVPDLPRADLWGGERLEFDLELSSFPDATGVEPAGGGRIDWRVVLEVASTAGSTRFEEWPTSDTRKIARLQIVVPEVEVVSCGELIIDAIAVGHSGRAIYRQQVVVVPGAMRRTSRPARIGVVDPLDLWSITARFEGLGHAVVAAKGADIVVAAQIDDELLADVARGRNLLLLGRSSDAIPSGIGLSRSMVVRRRHPGDDVQGDERGWDGDWTSVFAWALPGIVPGLPEGGLLGDAHGQVFPDHVIDWPLGIAPLDGVEIGLFAGWAHNPVALQTRLVHGAGELRVTTLKLTPEDGPVATGLLEWLVQRAAHGAAQRTVAAPGRASHARAEGE
jgi:glycosyl hydrolase family 2